MLSHQLRKTLSTKLIRQTYGEFSLHEHWCPGCKDIHAIAVEQPFQSIGTQWNWNGDVNKPTFSPSINIAVKTSIQCHYAIEDGKISFFEDCHHNLRGKTVDLPNIPKEYI